MAKTKQKIIDEIMEILEKKTKKELEELLSEQKTEEG